jgi:hypothetical protein
MSSVSPVCGEIVARRVQRRERGRDRALVGERGGRARARVDGVLPRGLARAQRTTVVGVERGLADGVREIVLVAVLVDDARVHDTVAMRPDRQGVLAPAVGPQDLGVEVVAAGAVTEAHGRGHAGHVDGVDEVARGVLDPDDDLEVVRRVELDVGDAALGVGGGSDRGRKERTSQHDGRAQDPTGPAKNHGAKCTPGGARRRPGEHHRSSLCRAVWSGCRGVVSRHFSRCRPGRSRGRDGFSSRVGTDSFHGRDGFLAWGRGQRSRRHGGGGVTPLD